MIPLFIKGEIEKIPEAGCWIWMGATTRGYGCLKINRKTVYAHRLAYGLYYGTIPDGMHVLHRCDTPSCVNPHHLFLGTNKDNIEDSVRKGRRKGVTRKRPSGLKYRPYPQETKNRIRKCSVEQIAEIKRLYASGKISQRALAKQFGVSSSKIWKYIHLK